MVREIKGVNICFKEKKSLLEISEMRRGGEKKKKRNVGEESKSTNVPRQQKSFVLGWCF